MLTEQLAREVSWQLPELSLQQEQQQWWKKKKRKKLVGILVLAV